MDLSEENREVSQVGRGRDMAGKRYILPIGGWVDTDTECALGGKREVRHGSWGLWHSPSRFLFFRFDGERWYWYPILSKISIYVNNIKLNFVFRSKVFNFLLQTQRFLFNLCLQFLTRVSFSITPLLKLKHIYIFWITIFYLHQNPISDTFQDVEIKFKLNSRNKFALILRRLDGCMKFGTLCCVSKKDQKSETEAAWRVSGKNKSKIHGGVGVVKYSKVLSGEAMSSLSNLQAWMTWTMWPSATSSSRRFPRGTRRLQRRRAPWKSQTTGRFYSCWDAIQMIIYCLLWSRS